jgi:hypothetical protein
MSRLRIPQRVRIYLGCEGQSEQSYGRLLSQIADGAGLHIHLDTDPLRGGDPLAIVELAVRHINQRKKLRGDFAYRAILLDRDKLGLTPERDRQIGLLSAENGLSVIWQTPCHEGFLLRHFEGQGAVRPATSDLALQCLRRVWPEYRKGMPASELTTRIDLAGIRRAASVEALFADFLDRIGLPRL